MPNNNRPSQYRRSALNGQRNITATQRRQNEALALRQRGMAYADIAHRLGYAAAQGAAEACRAASARLNNANVMPTNATATTTMTAPVVNVGGVASNRTFGIEAEFFGIRPQVAIDALAAVGIACSYEGYTHRVMNTWKIVTDGSVNSTGTGTGGLELVSPILQGEAGLAQAALAVSTLLAAGGRVDRSCGLHVHIGMNNLTGAEIMKVLDLYAANQSHINTIIARSRQSNSYCPPLNLGHGSRYNSYDTVRQARTVSDIRSATSNFHRYSVVNLTAYAKYGTIEFRQHQGTLNGEKVASWVKFLLALIEKATTMDNASQDLGSLSALMDTLPMADETKAFLNRRAARLTGSRS
jgi:hypothetical protein